MASSSVFRSAVRRAVQPQSCFKSLAVSQRAVSPITRRCFSNSPLSWVKKYTQDHEWIEIAADGKTATIGISTYAANALGDVVYAELPEAGQEFGAGDTIGAVESVKSASDIMAPVAGTVIEPNETLSETPSNLNKSPEGDAWLAKIELADPTEVDALMDEEAYKAFTDGVESS